MMRRPSIPPGARGLVAALAAGRRGDAYPLLLWHGGPRECLRTTLAGWCRDPELSDATVACIVTSAWRAGARGGRIRDELAWMSVTAAHHVADLARARTRALAHAMRFAASVERASREPASAAAAESRRRAHVRVVAAIALLPPPHAQAMTLLHVEGWNAGRAARWLMAWNPVTRDGARYILRTGREMLEAALGGRHPRVRWPRRYPGNPKWTTTPPSPERRL